MRDEDRKFLTDYLAAVSHTGWGGGSHWARRACEAEAERLAMEAERDLAAAKPPIAQKDPSKDSGS